MAFDYTNLYPDTSGNGGYTKSWNYTTVVDSIATCSASGYFNAVASRLGIGDNIVIARVNAFDTKARTTLVEYATLYVNGISNGVVSTLPSTTGMATTAYVDAGDTSVAATAAAATALKANIASPTFTGTPSAPTAAAGTNTTQLATTAGIVAERSATKTLTNTTFDSAGTGNVLKVSGVTVSAGQYPGEPSNGSATAGNIGEYISATVLVGSAVSLTTGTAKDVTTISLTAGDWDVWGNVCFQPAGTTTQSANIAWISTAANTLPVIPNGGAYTQFSVSVAAGLTVVLNAGRTRLSLSGTTTVSLGALANFAVSTETAYGFIGARRIR